MMDATLQNSVNWINGAKILVSFLLKKKSRLGKELERIKVIILKQ